VKYEDKMKKIIFILILLLVLFLNFLTGISTGIEDNGREKNDSITTQLPQFETVVENKKGGHALL
jgi:hypothetical protein